MIEFNKESYIEGQIRKQYKEEIISIEKQLLNFNVPTLTRELSELIMEKDILTLQSYVKAGRLTYTEILIYYLTCIIELQHYNAVIEINPDCLKIADALFYDDDHASIYGMPILIKGNIGTKNMHTTAGVAALKEFVCDDDAKIIKDIKAKGGIILGKANLSEWANFMSTESSNGYSALGGQTKNPYGHFDVGGSSSGSAVATALNLTTVAIGTETAGSIIYPSSQNSVVGLKPSLGLLSQDRIIPISKSHDTAGPMARNVKDIYVLLSAMAPIDIAIFEKDSLKDKKVGIINNKSVENYYRDDDAEIINRIKSELIAIKAIPSDYKLLETAFDTQVYDVLKFEFREGVKEFLKSYGTHKIQSIQDVITYNEQNLLVYAPYNHEIIHQAATEEFDAAVINKQIMANQKITRDALDKAFEEVDYLITLSNYCTSVYAPAGYPAITIPAGYRENGEPIGVTFIAPYMTDVKLIEIAYAYEQNRKHRKIPKEDV